MVPGGPSFQKTRSGAFPGTDTPPKNRSGVVTGGSPRSTGTGDRDRTRWTHLCKCSRGRYLDLDLTCRSKGFRNTPDRSGVSEKHRTGQVLGQVYFWTFCFFSGTVGVSWRKNRRGQQKAFWKLNKIISSSSFSPELKARDSHSIRPLG